MLTESPPEELYGLTEKSFKPAETRMKHARDARSLVTTLIRDDEPRAAQRALINANLAGNPPYSAGAIKSNKWVANINFMGTKARVSAAMNPYTALFSGVENYAACATSFQRNHPDKPKWDTAISRNFHVMLKSWREFDWHRLHRIRQMLVEGWAPVVFECDNFNWRYRALNADCIKVPKGSPSCLDDRVPYFAVLMPYRVHELYAKIRDEETAEKGKWNPEAVKAAIRNGLQGTGYSSANWQTANWKTVVDHLENHDLAASNDGTMISCAHLFVRELDKKGEKKISHFIITESELASGNASKKFEGDKGFLYSAPRVMDAYDERVITFFHNIGNGEWASIKGLAFDSFKHDIAINRLKSRALDAAFLESSLLLESPNQASKDKLQLTTFGVMTILPAGYKPAQSRMGGSLNSVVQMTRYLDQDLSQNLGSYNQRSVSDPTGAERPTATEVNAQVSKESSLSQGQIRLDYLTEDRVYDQMFKRAANPATDDEAALEFQEACRRDGVPEQALQEMEYVRANRLSGYGSAELRQLAAQKILEIAAMLPVDGQANLIDDYITGWTENPDNIERYNPRQQTPTPDDSLIALENGLIKEGGTPIIVSGQSHVKHLMGHVEFAATILEPIQVAMEEDQSDPIALEMAFQFLQVMGSHLEEHFAPVEADQTKRRLAQQFRVQIAELTAFHGKLRQAIRSARRQAQQAALEEQNATALGVMDQAKLSSMEADIERRNVKAQFDIELKRFKAGAGQQLQTWNAQQTAARETLKTVHKLSLEKAAA